MPHVASCRRFLALVVTAALATGGVSPGWAGEGTAPMTMPMGHHAGMHMPMGPRGAGAGAAFDSAALGIHGAQHLTLYVLPGGNGLGFVGPDKAHHDTMVPSSLVLRKGVPVTLTIINFDDMNHSITAPGLGINIIVQPGVDRPDGSVAARTTTFTFTPHQAGEFRWHCVFPCDMPSHWAMSADYDGPDRDGFMAGIIRVL